MSSDTPKIVVCGAGIAGIATAYQLAVKHGCTNVVLVEADNPLSLTSDKSTEAYRNWWPGPDRTMTAFMNRSIDLIEGIARESDNRINLNRRGYLFATADPSKVTWLHDMARLAQQHGAGAVRLHDGSGGMYSPTQTALQGEALDGADFITDVSLIRHHYPYLHPDTIAVAHVRRAGSLSAQQLGMFMLEAARENGVRMIRGKVVGIDTSAGKVQAVDVECTPARQQEERIRLDATHVVLAAGPMLQSVAALLGVELPIVAERHMKISLPDTLGIVARNAPMLIWLDEQHLPWNADERAALAADGTADWLLEQFPGGVHCRPDGSGTSQTLLGLYTYESEPQDVVFPLPEDPHYAEIVLRGLSTMVPELRAYIDNGTRPFVDGGYYIKTRENRPLIGPLPVHGAFVTGAYSGFGIMASCAGGDLVARHIVGAPLPDYATAFMLSRYSDPDYLALLDEWGDDGQL